MFKSFARFFLTITTAAVLALPLSASAYAAGANPITLDTSAWAGTSGTIKAAYAGYPVKLGAATLAYSGNWNYTGSFEKNVLEGTFSGTWSITGLAALSPTYSVMEGQPLTFNAVFSKGMISSGGISVYGQQVIDLKGQSQATILGLLF